MRIETSRGRLAERQSSDERAGLTLMELVVVMAVLAALAAILVPMFPNMLRRAHKVTDATQTSEMTKAMQLYQAAFIGYPKNYDLLTDGTSFTGYLPGASSGSPFGGFVTAAPLEAAEEAALQKVGVLTVQKLATTSTSTAFHPTRYPYDGTLTSSAVTLAPTATTSSNQKFAVINIAAAQSANPGFLQVVTAADPNAKYVVFGVGARTSMIGQTIQDAPTSVPQDPTFTPDNTYCRVGVIFKVSGLEVDNADNRAKFIASVALEDDELESTEKDLVGYYQVAAGTNNQSGS